MSTALVTFEDVPLVFHEHQGRPCLIVADAGKALGYGAGGLADVIRKQWGEEMIEGKDFDVLVGPALKAFKARAEATEGSSVGRVAHLMVLYESGWDLVCIKTEKPAGRRLRRFLADAVLPQLRRAPGPVAGEFRPVEGAAIGEPVKLGATGRPELEAPPSPAVKAPPRIFREQLERWAKGRATFSMDDALEGLGIAVDERSLPVRSRVGIVLAAAGYTRHGTRLLFHAPSTAPPKPAAHPESQRIDRLERLVEQLLVVLATGAAKRRRPPAEQQDLPLERRDAPKGGGHA